MQRVVSLILIMLLGFAAPARATVNSAANSITVPGNGVATSFTFSYIGVTAADIAVIHTTAAGVQTLLTQGPGATQYTVTLNSAVAPSLWGIGGAVVYNPSGTPIPAGDTLTITRVLPFTQSTSLQNQASFGQYASATETAIDQVVMQVQQLATQIGYAIQANPANSAAPSVLPPAAQALGMGLCFDSVNGNSVIACSLAPSGVISSAMAPVVGAASLAAGRSAFGLGTMAVENINGGSCGGPSIQDDGAGYARVVQATVQDSTNQAVTCNYNLTYHIASGPLTYTLPRSLTTFFNGFSFTINSLVGVTTIAVNAADNFSGLASGTSISIPQGVTCTITTNEASSGVWYKTCSSSQASLAANVGASALTLTLYGTSLSFRDPTLANGDLVGGVPSAGLSIVVPSGATLGTSNSTPFRIWIYAFYNGGTPVLGVILCSVPGSIGSCGAFETLQLGGTLISNGATSSGILYSAATVSNSSVRLIGYAEYASGLSTAGTWASTPTTLQVCVPPITCRHPGDIVQMVTASTATAGSTASTTLAALTTGPTATIYPSSSANFVKVTVSGSFSISGGSGVAMQLQIARSSTLIGNPMGGNEGASNKENPITVTAYDAPGSAGAVTYQLYGKTASNTLTFPTTTSGSLIELWEIMSAIEPANDNNTEPRMVG